MSVHLMTAAVIRPGKRCVPCHGSGRMQIHFRTRRKSYWKDCVMCDGLGWVDMPWLSLRGDGGRIDHILDSSKGGWHLTVCGDWTPNGEIHYEPTRRCRKCVKWMKTERADGAR